MIATEKTWGISGNALKLLAAALMTVDHIGLIFFPRVLAWRIIGRLSMPIFAFMVAQGCKYTRSRLKYLGNLFACLALCQIPYYVAYQRSEICILGTFFVGATLLFCLQDTKKALADGKWLWGIFGVFSFIFGVCLTYLLNKCVSLDYGFWGCMLPVFAGLLYCPDNAPPLWKKLDNKWTSLLFFGIGLYILAKDSGISLQAYCLFSLGILALYSGRRGKGGLKYFFYLFYPLHLALLQGLYLLLHN